jgi:drug/metabolite transporter (DMT)-like permease
MAFVNGVPPVESTFFRTSIIAAVFAIAAVVQGEAFRIPRAALPSFIAQSAATLIVSVGYLASVQFIPVGLAVIIFFFFPVLIMIGAPIIEGHNPGLLRIGIAIVAFAGLAVAIGPSFESLDIRGILLAAGAAIGGAMQFFSGRSISRYMTPSVFGSLVHLAIWPAVLAVALVAGGGRLQFLPGGTASSTGLLFMSGLAVLYVIAYMVQMLSLRFAPASTVAPFYNLEPVVTTAVAALLLGERMQINQYAGGGMVLAALVASSFIGLRKS